MSRTPLAAAVLLSALALAGCQAAGPDPAASGTGDPAATRSGAASSAPSRAPEASPSVRTPQPRTPQPRTPSPKARPGERITIPPDLPTAHDRGLVVGGDVSWPQCPRGMGIPQKRTLGAPMPVESVEFVILGLTNGPAFHPNPCLADQVQWVKDRRLLAAAYSVLSYPTQQQLATYADQGPYDSSTAAGKLGNVGYAQALFNLETMRRSGLESPIVWLDVEPVSDFEWSADAAANAAVVTGARRAYEDEGYDVGVYSTGYMWQEIVGDLSLGLPEWRPAGETSRAEALRRCGDAAMFQGGHGVLGQWVENDRDMNVTCPGTSAFLEVWFHDF